MISSILRTSALVAGSVLLVSAAHAESENKAAELLTNVVKAIQAAETNQVTIDIVSKGTVPTPMGMQEMEQRILFDMAAAQPNKFRRLTTMEDRLVEARVSDGNEMTSFLGDISVYQVEKAPDSLAGIAAVDPVAQLSLLPSMLGSTETTQLLDIGMNHTYAGEIDRSGTKSHRVNFDTPEGPAYIIVSTGNPPVLQQIVMGDGTPITTTYNFQWKAGELAQNAFVFEAPEGAKKVDSIQDEISKMQGGGSMPNPKDLIGEAAPAIKLANLAGKPVDISTHVGKDVVLLDFWATWCGPCIRAMPIIQSVAEEYKDKGVVVYTVNLEEGVEEVKDFLAKHNLSLEVLMDTEGEVSESYRAFSIPQTVLIDKEGKVAKVHVGLLPNLKETLRAELNELLGATATP